jgi:hypothetical protein
MGPKELVRRLDTEDHRSLVDALVFHGVPYAFKDSPGEYTMLLRELSRWLGVRIWIANQRLFRFHSGLPVTKWS